LTAIGVAATRHSEQRRPIICVCVI